MTTAKIRLRPSGFALVDKADELLVSGFVWRKSGKPGEQYALAQRGALYIYMHRLIIGAGPDDRVDHANGNRLDNRSANLRLATASQNSANRGADRRRAGTSSAHKGVSWSAARSKWVAYIHHQGKTRYLGRYDSEEQAAIAYNQAATDTWGDFARLNVVGERT